jgi:hypothetical protein
MADEKQPEEPRTPQEAKRMRKEWRGIVSDYKRPKLNRPGINHYEGSEDLPKPGRPGHRWQDR